MLSQASTVEQLTNAALALSNEEKEVLAERLVKSLDPADREIQRLWAEEAIKRRDEVRGGHVATIPGSEGLERVRRAITR